MVALKRLKRTWSDLKAGAPGKRFQHHHKRKRQRGWRKPILFITGAALIAVGIALSLPPGVPGFVVMILGAGLIASQSRTHAVRSR